jgi:hypothetical protein
MSSVRPNATLTCSKTQYCVAFNATDTVAHSSGSFWAPGLVGQAVNAHNSARLAHTNILNTGSIIEHDGGLCPVSVDTPDITLSIRQ